LILNVFVTMLLVRWPSSTALTPTFVVLFTGNDPA
jgi:hypothetical protein